MRLILASQSPRRRALLSEAGYEFEVIVPSEEVEAGGPEGDPTEVYVARLAVQKAADVASRLEQSAGDEEESTQIWIIACDTVAECDGVILEKPDSRADAERMLRMLSGREHSVWSGLCVWNALTGEFCVETARSVLVMAPLTDRLIEDYLDSGAWEGKSGAFGYQDDLPWLELKSGSASNVVGLPMELLREILADLTSREESEG